MFATIPRRLDGTGATVVALCTEATKLIDAAAAPLAARQTDDVARLEARVKELGERGSGRKQLEDRHKRELRRHRTDELLAGLTVIAGSYRDAMVAGTAGDATQVAAGVTQIHAAMEAFERNPNESLMLQDLLWSLPVLSSGPRR